MKKENSPSVHWADIHARNIIRSKGDKAQYVCASGITPSGTVHIGNFREIISVELVVRALRDLGRDVRFIYSWDDFDVFRKVPKNMPEQELLQSYLRKPITVVPDTTGTSENYARANEERIERQLHIVGIDPEYIYQARQYQAGTYAQSIRTALEHREEIRACLNKHRREPLPESWMPVSVFSSFTGRDATEVISWDGQWGITYQCLETGKEETLDMRSAKWVKLPWRIDWPMRWAFEGVDFEPAGKDHHSEGGSFDTAKEIVKVFGSDAPYTFQYDFIRIKGKGGKISSSSGEVVSLTDVLEIYQPEIVRYLFAGTRPNTEFAVSFDLDVLKIYEDYDKCERIYYGDEEVGEKRRQKESRIYELSQVSSVPEDKPYQVPFRHLCNLLQIHSRDIDSVISSLGVVEKHQEERLRTRCACALNWLDLYAPEEFTFSLREPGSSVPEFPNEILKALGQLCHVAERMDDLSDSELSEEIYAAAHASGCEPKDLFAASYQVLIGKERGPRLAGFMRTCGREKVIPLLRSFAQ